MQFIRVSNWLILATGVGATFGLISSGWDVFALMFTAVVLIWYSIETRQLRFLSTAPGLVLRWANGGDLQGITLRLSNQGKGAALNPAIRLNRPDLILEGFDDLNAVTDRDEHIGCVAQGDSRLYWQESFRRLNLDTNPLIATIIFQGMDGVQHSTIIELKQPPRARIIKASWL